MTMGWRGEDGRLGDHTGDYYNNRAQTGLRALRTQRSECIREISK